MEYRHLVYLFMSQFSVRKEAEGSLPKWNCIQCTCTNNNQMTKREVVIIKVSRMNSLLSLNVMSFHVNN